MHPAISVIFFTVTSGAGFGFMAMLGLGADMPEGPLAAFLIAGLAGILAIVGLVSSTFHLGHPERAWRAFSQWRSSWLSREGVLAVITLILFGIYALIWMIIGTRIGWLGILVAIGGLATVYATAMIYAQLKTVPQWHSSLTPVCYLLFSIAGGILLTAAISPSAQLFGIDKYLLSFLLVSVAWVAKLLWWQHAGARTLGSTGSSTESATGLGFIGKVRLFEKPHSGENYLTKEMVHKIGRKHANKLRMISLILGFIVPLLLCLIAYFIAASPALLAIAFVLFVAGLFVERWLFFAEATHAVSLYY